MAGSGTSVLFLSHLLNAQLHWEAGTLVASSWAVSHVPPAFLIDLVGNIFAVSRVPVSSCSESRVPASNTVGWDTSLHVLWGILTQHFVFISFFIIAFTVSTREATHARGSSFVK